LEGLSRPNGVTVCFNALPLNKKKEIIASITAQGFKEGSPEIRGIGKTPLFQWKLTLEEPKATEQAKEAEAEPALMAK
jgi:hypothetical protein